MADVDLNIAGRSYRIACRDGEEANLRTAAAMVDQKSREALAGLGTLSEARQLLFASLLLADQLIDKKSAQPPSPTDELAAAANALASRLERLAETLERDASSS
ncbi:cell division protein ZapA [Sphingomonas piscis]|uniref:Cell division protein ZapA n=1 Tax=Sphingomonas piscis TaxID=2714943 RepID=A0A6G7YSL7_9SPHN|nr:cell division protein ZapA [Sphingomonas piscis]QIK79729.1 cell division protein ZapA [Sphingomonas piscis]